MFRMEMFCHERFKFAFQQEEEEREKKRIEDEKRRLEDEERQAVLAKARELEEQRRLEEEENMRKVVFFFHLLSHSTFTIGSRLVCLRRVDSPECCYRNHFKDYNVYQIIRNISIPSR